MISVADLRLAFFFFDLRFRRRRRSRDPSEELDDVSEDEDELVGEEFDEERLEDRTIPSHRSFQMTGGKFVGISYGLWKVPPPAAVVFLAG
jgi:hypothetical protein